MFLHPERFDQCQKCGRSWTSWDDALRSSSDLTPRFAEKPDRLDYTCPTCGYVQHVRCRDAKKETKP